MTKEHYLALFTVCFSDDQTLDSTISVLDERLKPESLVSRTPVIIAGKEKYILPPGGGTLALASQVLESSGAVVDISSVTDADDTPSIRQGKVAYGDHTHGWEEGGIGDGVSLYDMPPFSSLKAVVDENKLGLIQAEQDSEDALAKADVALAVAEISLTEVTVDNLPDNIPADKLPDLEDMNGTLTNSQIEQLMASKVPNLENMNGTLLSSQLQQITVDKLPANIPANNLPQLSEMNGELPASKVTGQFNAKIKKRVWVPVSIYRKIGINDTESSLKSANKNWERQYGIRIGKNLSKLILPLPISLYSDITEVYAHYYNPSKASNEYMNLTGKISIVEAALNDTFTEIFTLSTNTKAFDASNDGMSSIVTYDHTSNPLTASPSQYDLTANLRRHYGFVISQNSGYLDQEEYISFLGLTIYYEEDVIFS